MSSDSSTVAAEGNTIPPSRQISPSIRWCFTLHNYTDSDIENISSVCSNKAKYSIWSEELGKEGETPHLQGYIEFNSKVRPKNMFVNNTIHWEKSKGNRQQNIDYCSKENGNVYLNGKLKKPLKLITNLYDWQQEIIDLVSAEADDRSIHWFHESEGNKGKSALTKLLCAKYGAITLSGKGSDMKNGILQLHQEKGVYPEIVIIDIPRCVNINNHISYTGVEEIKNGCFFSPKYEGGMCIFNSPHVLIFSNHDPPLDKLSTDRWIVKNI